MSTFAVFGMTAAAALADARKKTKTTKPSGKAGCPPLDLALAEWQEAVQRNVEAIMTGERVKQLSCPVRHPAARPAVHRTGQAIGRLPRPAHSIKGSPPRRKWANDHQPKNKDARYWVG
ncbi:hypothetical protein [Pseudomonas peradeniyensis]|uniref:hypothetical protein n=1 Tax=Pseudomonas peradeniyensis TaxID=2745488 RepID=UPI001CEC2AA0|nr:hypothetical protein [Pseudomonas peradeniyensis]